MGDVEDQGCVQTRHGLIFGMVISKTSNMEDGVFYIGFFSFILPCL